MTLSEIVKLSTGIATGDKAATATAAGGVLKLQSSTTAALSRMGSSLSALVSPAVFRSLNDGAVKTADSDLNKVAGQFAAEIPQTCKLAGLALAALLGWAIFFRRG
jgi:hypothetical protein